MIKSRLIPVIILCMAAACSDTADTQTEADPNAAAAEEVRDRFATGAPSCGIADTTALTNAGIGELRVGMSVSQARALCRVLRDSVGRLEGMPMPLLLVDLGRDTIIAETSKDRIWRLWVDSPVFRTRGGLGVGSTVAELRANGSARVARGEGTFILLEEQCGLSFQIRDPRIAALPVTIPARDLPADISVVKVLVYGCDPAQRGGDSS